MLLRRSGYMGFPPTRPRLDARTSIHRRNRANRDPGYISQIRGLAAPPENAELGERDQRDTRI